MFRTVPLSIIRSFPLYIQQWYMSYRFANSLRAGSGRNSMTNTVLCVQWKNPDGGQRNCPKHVEFYSKNKFKKLLHLVDFIIRFITMHSHLNRKFSILCVAWKRSQSNRYFYYFELSRSYVVVDYSVFCSLDLGYIRGKESLQGPALFGKMKAKGVVTANIYRS